MDVPSGGVILEIEPCHGPSTGIMISGYPVRGVPLALTLKTFGPPKIFIGFAFVQTLRWVRLPRTITTLYHPLRHR